MKEYFYKKEYKYMYLAKLSYSFGNALIETFGTVMLYKSGIPIWLILLIYGLRFGITGVFLVTKNKVIISFNKTLNDNFEKVYETSIQTSIQNIIKESKENNELLSAVGQMSLCFTEVIVFAILAIVATFIGENVFYVIFLLSIISTIGININIKRENKNRINF